MAKEDTRNKILTAAEKLFSKNGYDGAATKMIASEAGVTEMTLFNHFANKKLLYKSVVKERYLALEIESVISTLTYDDLEKDIMKISLALFDHFVNNKTILMMRLKEKQSFQNDKSFTMEKDPLLMQIKPVFETYGKKGSINGSSERAALLFMAAFKGLCHICILENMKEDDFKVLIRDYVRTICQGMNRGV